MNGKHIITPKVRSRDMMVWAVMSALTVFVNLFGVYTVQFYGGSAMVILTGIGLGAKSGIIVGALARLVCNFFTGQGPWTIWQMCAWALLGGISGAVFGRKKKVSIWLVSIYAFFIIMVLYGGIMNMGALFMSHFISPVETPLNWQTAAAVYAAGIPYDLIHATGCGICVFVFGDNLIAKLIRIKKKYRLNSY